MDPVAPTRQAGTRPDNRLGILKLSSSSIPERERTTLLREAYAGTIVRHSIEPLAGDVVHFRAEFHRLPGLDIAFMESSGLRGIRTEADGDDDDVLLNLTLAGRRKLSQQGLDVTAGIGDVVLSRPAPGTCIVSSGSRWISIRIPRRWLAVSVADLDGAMLKPIPLDLKPMSLLLEYVEVVRSAKVALSADVRHFAVEHILDLVALVIGAARQAGVHEQGRGLRAVHLRSIRQDIADHAHDRSFSLGSLARRRGISTSYVKKILRAEGASFTELVRQQRLRFARRLLLDPRWRARSIRDIADATGFGDFSFFSRAFHELHGKTPAELRDSMLAPLRERAHDVMREQ